MFFGSLGTRRKVDHRLAQQIRVWVSEALHVEREQSLLVTEVHSPMSPHCSPFETVILLLGDDNIQQHYRIPKPFAEVTLDDVMHMQKVFSERESSTTYPFVWSGIYNLRVGKYYLTLQPGPFSEMNITLFSALQNASREALEALVPDATQLFLRNQEKDKREKDIQSPCILLSFQIHDKAFTCPMLIEQPGLYALFTQHHPVAYHMEVHSACGLLAPLVSRVYASESVQ